MYTFNPSIQEAEAGWSLEFKASQGYTEKPYLRIKKRKEIKFRHLKKFSLLKYKVFIQFLILLKFQVSTVGTCKIKNKLNT